MTPDVAVPAPRFLLRVECLSLLLGTLDDVTGIRGGRLGLGEDPPVRGEHPDGRLARCAKGAQQRGQLLQGRVLAVEGVTDRALRDASAHLGGGGQQTLRSRPRFLVEALLRRHRQQLLVLAPSPAPTGPVEPRGAEGDVSRCRVRTQVGCGMRMRRPGPGNGADTRLVLPTATTPPGHRSSFRGRVRVLPRRGASPRRQATSLPPSRPP